MCEEGGTSANARTQATRVQKSRVLASEELVVGVAGEHLEAGEEEGVIAALCHPYISASSTAPKTRLFNFAVRREKKEVEEREMKDLQGRSISQPP